MCWLFVLCCCEGKLRKLKEAKNRGSVYNTKYTFRLLLAALCISLLVDHVSKQMCVAGIYDL